MVWERENDVVFFLGGWKRATRKKMIVVSLNVLLLYAGDEMRSDERERKRFECASRQIRLDSSVLTGG